MLQQQELLGYSINVFNLDHIKNFYRSSDIKLSNIGHEDAFVHDFPFSRILQFSNKELAIIIDSSSSNSDVAGSLYHSNFEMGEYYLSKLDDGRGYSNIPSLISFDTVKFGIPVTLDQLDAFRSVFCVSHISENYTVNQELGYSFQKFMFVTHDESLSLPSHNKFVVFSYDNPRDVNSLGQIVVELSIPKQLYGHNSLLFWSLDVFFDRFRLYLNDCLGVDLIRFSDWIIKRIDVCYNFHLSSFEHVKNTISYLSSLRLRNKVSHKRGWAYWASQTNTVKFYSKFEEMKKHKDSFDPDIYDVVLKNSQNILRFEHEWRSKYLLQKLGVNKVSLLTVGRFLDYVIKHYNYNSHIRQIIGDFTMNDKKISLSDLMDSIDKGLSKSAVYKKFIYQIIDNGLDKTKSSLSKSIYYHRVKQLKGIGIDVSVVDEHFHNHSEVKEPDKDFVNAPLSNLTDEEALYIDSKLNRSTPVTKLQDFLKQKGVRMTIFDGRFTSLPSGYQLKPYK